MTSRLLFEEDVTIMDDGDNNPKENVVKEKDLAENYSTNESQDSNTPDTKETAGNNSEVILDNIIILGSKTNEKRKNSNNENHTSQDEDKNPHDDGNTFKGEGNATQDDVTKGNVTQDDVTKGNVTPEEVKPEGKRRLKKELESLLSDLNPNEDDLDEDKEYDGFGDENAVFRKYKLRKGQQTVSYKEPADIRLKYCDKYSETAADLNCPICKKVFDNKVGFYNHLRIHNKRTADYTCSLCNMKFEKGVDLIAHKETHKGESFLCQECKLAFSNYCDYLLHNYVHLKKPYFECSECGLRYRKSGYKKHVMTHFDYLKLSCDLCPFVAKSTHHLQTHLNQHNNRYTCIECGKVSNNKTTLDYHMSMHTGVKKFQCLYCGIGFRGKNARKIHHRIHTGEKPYECGICGQKSRQWSDHKRHKESHVTEKKYICDICGKKYLHKDSVIVHMRSHTKKSLYECPECNAKFVSVGGLRVHSMYKHMSERPVECKLCNKKFINENQYKKHCRAKYHLRNVYGSNMSASSKE